MPTEIEYVALSGDDGGAMPNAGHGSPAIAAAENTLVRLASRLGLSFWGHRAEDADFIVVRRDVCEFVGGSR